MAQFFWYYYWYYQERSAEVAKGRIFQITQYALHDGPGIRTTVFLKGCPARCLWCCSPQSQSFEKELFLRHNLCRGCGRCVAACPNSVLSWDGRLLAQRERCGACGRCRDVCPEGAITLLGQDLTAEELFAIVRRDAPFWRRSRGGMTLSGGEVLAQPDFAAAFLTLCRDRGIHTAIETSLAAPFSVVKAVCQLADLVQFDIKALSPSLHRELTGLEAAPILDSARWLLEGDRDLLVRYPLIPGVNDGESELTALADFCFAHRRSVRIEFLPYHELGLFAYEALERRYPLTGARPPTMEEMRRANRILERFPLTEEEER